MDVVCVPVSLFFVHGGSDNDNAGLTCDTEKIERYYDAFQREAMSALNLAFRTSKGASVTCNDPDYLDVQDLTI